MHRLCLTVMALLVGAAVSNASAQPVTPGIVSSPCPPPDPAAEARLKAIDDLFMTPAASPEVFWADFAKLQATVPAGDAERNRARQLSDWPNLCRYKATNGTLADGPRPRAVFMGDSITDKWGPTSTAPMYLRSGSVHPWIRLSRRLDAHSADRSGSTSRPCMSPVRMPSAFCFHSGSFGGQSMSTTWRLFQSMTQTALMPVACANIRLVEPSALAVPVGEADDVV